MAWKVGDDISDEHVSKLVSFTLKLKHPFNEPVSFTLKFIYPFIEGFDGMVMPQIRCPNCGITINLKARKKTDFKMILGALKRKPKTFTDLLKTTGLPRKTLSLRLSALRDSGLIVKDGSYSLSGSPLPEGLDGRMVSFEGESVKKHRFLPTKNMLTILMLLLIGVPIIAGGSAMFFASQAPPSPPPSPQYIGTFKMDLNIEDAADLFAWQVLIHFNASELVVVEVAEGNFFDATSAPNNPVFVYEYDFQDSNKLFIGNSLVGQDTIGTTGNGLLATITFGYNSESYEQPYIVFDNKVHETLLLNSDRVPLTTGTLKLEIKS